MALSIAGALVKYQGSCHCGKIAFDVEGELAQAVECNCSHCSRKGFLLWFVPREQMTLSTPAAQLSTYTFNKHLLKHHFCAQCGCAPFSFGTSPDGVATAAINIRCLNEIDLAAIKRVPVDGRSF